MLYNEQGEEVEGSLSAEEVEAKLEEERTKMEEQNSKDLEEVQKQSDEALEEKEKELTAKEEELAKEMDKEKNFGALRGKTKEKDEKIDALMEEIKGIKETLESTKSVVSEQKIDTAIEKLSADKEMKDKIKFYYNSFKDEPKDDKEFQKRIENANVLAGGSKPTNALTGDVISSAGGTVMEGSGTGKKLGPEALEEAKKLGITDAELAKAKLK